jgi:dTDP-4-amino-4,6-dideoxygalactose transaminase
MSQLALSGGAPAAAHVQLAQWPIVEQPERDAVNAVLDRGVFTNSGTVEVPALEQEYRAYVGTDYCLATNAGTHALHCCAVAVGLGPGDEAIVPAFTYAASAMFVALTGATPVFADVDLATYNIDPAAIEAAITPRTKAIVVVHLHGLPADMDAIQAVADRHGLPIIEDTAQAHGALYDGKIVGTLGACAGTSLNQAKNLPGGEGGFFLTNDPEHYKVARRLRYLGEDLEAEQDPAEGRRYWCHGVGWNYRAQELPAAFARAQLRRLPDHNARALAAGTRLSERLAQIDGIVPPHVPAGRVPVYHIYRARLEDDVVERFASPQAARDAILRALHAEGVAASIWQHYPLPAHPVFRRPLAPWHPSRDTPLAPYRREQHAVAADLTDRSFVIGSGAHPMAVFDEAAVDAYADAIAKVLDGVDELAALGLEPFASNFEPAI